MGKMNLMWVYVTVGAISFVKCELGFDFATPFYGVRRSHTDEGTPPSTAFSLLQKRFRTATPTENPLTNSNFPSWQTNFSSERDARRHEDTISGDLEENEKVETKVEETEEKEKDFSELFTEIRRIYVRCKTKVNRSLKSLSKGKVNSRLSELKVYVTSVYQCVKVLGFRALDELLQEDFIRVTDHAYLVRDAAPAGRTAAPAPRALPLKDFAERVLAQEWTALFCQWLDNLLNTHSLKLRLERHAVSQGRGRRRDHRMFAMMVMGFMIMASILIPMGFQFLTVLGGKSLLLAKMALIISAINGLKKIATSNVSYGLYHTGSEGHHHDHLHHGFHEKHYHLNPQNYNGHHQGYN